MLIKSQCQFNVPFGKGLGSLFEHTQGLVCQRFDQEHFGNFLLFGHFLAPPTDILGFIGDPLEVGRNLHRRGHDPQVGRHGIEAIDDLQPHFVDLSLVVIHRRVIHDGLVAEILVPVEHPLDSTLQIHGSHTRHDENGLFYILQAILEFGQGMRDFFGHE